MNRAVFVVLGLLAAQRVVPAALVVPAVPDVMIKTRRIFDRPDASIATTIVHLKGPRQRLDTIVDLPPLAGSGVGRTQTHAGTQISQCDERRTVLLNDEAKTFAFLPIADASIDARRAEWAVSPPPESGSKGAEVTITVDAVDTGERRAMGRLVARRVITTTRTAPGPGASTPRSDRKQDGWYVDLPSPNCSEPGDMPQAILLGVAQRPGTPQDRVHITTLGRARRGFPIEETNRTTDEYATTTARIELVEFSEALLGDSLFTVPSDYRPALPIPFGGYDLTKPDTVMNRLESYWYGLSTWAGLRRRSMFER